MYKIKKMLLPIIFGALLLTQACASQDIPSTPVEQKPTQIVPTPINDLEEVELIIEQLESGDQVSVPETGESEDLEEEEDSPVEPSAQVDHCIECHADKEMLISTAKAEEEVLSENEGEG